MLAELRDAYNEELERHRETQRKAAQASKINNLNQNQQ